jgi:hypothetical protein
MPWPPRPIAGRSTYCGILNFTCPDSGKTYGWPVYGNSEEAQAITQLIGPNACATLFFPQRRIVCTGDCDKIKGWISAGWPYPVLLNHEACHACAYETHGPWGWCKSWIPGDLTGYCDKHSVPSIPLW